MSEFKGTKGKWRLANNDYGYYTSVRNLDDTRKICVSRVNDMTKSNANMLLISKAPEILKELQETITDLLCIQGSVYDACKTDKRWEGIYEIIQKQIDRKKELIKQATEL